MSTIATSRLAMLLLDECADLGLRLQLEKARGPRALLRGPADEAIQVELHPTRQPRAIEQVLAQLVIDFETLPLLVKGDSKEIRLLTPRIVVAKLLPTVYSFTHNRYGVVPGTEHVRARFTSAIFGKMLDSPENWAPSTAFLGAVPNPSGLLLAERRVDVCNLEVRVKRFHIGSPLHRYRYTEQHPTAAGKPLTRWTRFPEPLVCFDWRHPITDENGHRLADEPLSDDYAGVWMRDITGAKALARRTFLWLERLFSHAGLTLVDICFFIDRTGRVIYGEISPDCMRVRSAASDNARALDKDHWRSGGDPSEVLARYEELEARLFEPRSLKAHHFNSHQESHHGKTRNP